MVFPVAAVELASIRCLKQQALCRGKAQKKGGGRGSMSQLCEVVRK
jgi:hypothetical protein